MTTQELVEKLQKCDPSLQIFVRNVFFSKDIGKPRDCVDKATQVIVTDGVIVISADDSVLATRYSKKDRL